MVRCAAALALVLLQAQTALCRRNTRLQQRDDDCTPPDGFSRCIFYDDFSGSSGSQPSSSKWTIDVGDNYPGGPAHWGQGDIETYTSDSQNIQLTGDGTLKITPVRGDDGSWTSGRMETTSDWDFYCASGERLRIEASIKLGDDSYDKQLGIWPSFWALGSDFRGNYQNWPKVGEIDIFESINGEPKIWHVVHCGVVPGGPCNEYVGLSQISDPVGRGEWHTAAWEVDRSSESMTWYIDDVEQWTLAQSDVGDDDAWEALAAGSKMVLLNVAVGGAFPDAVSGVHTPTDDTAGGDGASMEVDYVAVYST